MRGAFGNDDRFELNGQTAEIHALGNWSESGWSQIRSHRHLRICVGSVGNFDRFPNTDRCVFKSTDANKLNRRCYAEGLHSFDLYKVESNNIICNSALSIEEQVRY
jgi:hypothetical protein